MLAFLNVALEGLAWAGMAGNCPGGELDNMAQVVVQPLIKCVEENRDRGTSARKCSMWVIVPGL